MTRFNRTRAVGALLLALGSLLLAALQANADDAKPMRGVALVIGESRYQHIAPLPNPANDARAVDRLLGDLGFEVTPVPDGDAARLKRSLTRFVEDAQGADVALIYYSGHGIEAGGENYLVPVDADPSSLGTDGLVPLSEILAELKSTVPVSIVLLDACRTNPFPDGTTIRTSSGAAPIAAAGLDIARGAAPLADTTGAPQSLGTVIGFAAEPGHVALDGDAGGNSPYAQALLKHLAAGGFAFGDVMTMVAEEVYVKTGGRQLPWTNASLRRLLYFGLQPEETGTDEASIRGERRKLLLSIAATPVQTRSLVEQVAAANDVPLDALYGMLQVLDVDTSGGSQAIDSQLAAGAARLRAVMAERDVQKRQDPEIIRLSALADRAQDEGAMALALQFRAKASARAGDISKAIDEAEADVKARRLELASTFATHADTALLNFDYRTAADRYHDAFIQAERWDESQAFLYRIKQGDALTDLGMERGENGAFMEAIDVYEAAKLLPGVDDYVGGAVGVNINEGITLTALAQRDTGTKWVEKAIDVYEEGARLISRKKAPAQWASVQLNLGNAYDLMSDRAGGTSYSKKALAAFREAEKVYTRKAAPFEWAGLQNNIAGVLQAMGRAGDGRKNFSQAIKAYDGALSVWTRENDPTNWAMVQTNLGNTLYALSELEPDTKNLEAAVGAMNASLGVRTRENHPMDWAGTQNGLGSMLLSLGQRGKGEEYFQQALDAFDKAQQEMTRDRDPFNWGTTAYNKSRAFKFMAEREGSKTRYGQALEQVNDALTAFSRETTPVIWARAHSVRGDILLAIGSMDHDAAKLRQAREDYHAARDMFREQKFTTNFEDFYARQDKLLDEELAKIP